MCGISGAVGSPDRHETARMTGLLAHRGPDADGFRSFDGCEFGHRRLRIVDLSPLGDQPMSEEAGRAWIVYNGELYNYVELRAALKGRGHTFRSATDTEVIVHLYEEYGDDLVHHIRGMYAFALWDDATRRLLLARDRLGIKPLYYRTDGPDLTFASEVRALARPADAIDPAAVASLLRLGWIAGPGTVLQGIRELPPGHLLTWQDGHATERRWWAPPPADGAQQDGDLAEILRDSVSRHLVADVPTGVFLSSGVDSVALTRVASRVGEDVRTYTVAFDEGPDEAAAAASYARDFGVRHEVVRVSGSEVRDRLGDIVTAMDQPSVDGVNSWIISRAVRDAGVVVALSGLGGDELFGGYSTFRHVPRLAKVRALVPMSAGLPRRFGAGFARTRAGRAVEAMLSDGQASPYAAVRGLLSWSSIERLWPGVRAVVPGGDADLVRPGLPGVGGVTGLELGNYLPYQLLRDTDAMSMDHSVEVRVPLLDDDILGWALRRGAPAGKQALAAAADPALAHLAAERKRTFTLPFDRWLRGPLAERTHAALVTLARTPGLELDRAALLDLWSAYQGGQVGWRSLWGPAALGMWIESRGLA